MMLKTAVVVGATGMVGIEVERQLWQTPGVEAVRVLVRRPFTPADARTEVLQVDFSQPGSWQPLLRGDVLFCCLGTTSRQAGSRAAFRAVDYDLPLALAQAAAANGLPRMVVMSSMGADTTSAIFYSRVKGEMERDVRRFAPLQVAAVRPSLLLGQRQEVRPGEQLGAVVMQALDFLVPPRYKAIRSQTVARAMIAIAQQADMKAVYENDALLVLGHKAS